MNKSIQQPELNYPFRHFQSLGIILGGIGPIAIFFGIAVLFGLKDFYISKSGIGWIVIFLILVAGLTFFLYHKEVHHGQKQWFSYIFSAQAICCFILTHLIMYYTGGARGSVFAFTCLYIPSIVGYVYGKKGVSLKGAAIFMAIIYTYNLFFSVDYKHEDPASIYEMNHSLVGFSGPVKTEWIYLAIFILQLSILWLIAAQREDLKFTVNTESNE